MSRREEILRLVATLPHGPPPPPWRLTLDHTRSGLMALGFADDTDLLLLLCSDRRQVIDCVAGRVVADESEGDALDGWDEANLACAGVGPLAGVRVRMAGLWGGGLSSHTHDGWSLELLGDSWDPTPVLAPPGVDLFGPRTKGCVRLDWRPYDDRARGCGSSPTGRTLVLADADHAEVFARDGAP